MNYISAEQFLEQPKKVQEVLLKWWKPSKGDVFAFLGDDSSREIGVLGDLKEIQIATKGKGEYRLPLLTEGQLREFIEDKTNCKISVSPSIEGKYYVGYDKYANNEDGDLTRLTYANDVLSGYWKVVCKIAEEVANE